MHLRFLRILSSILLAALLSAGCGPLTPLPDSTPERTARPSLIPDPTATNAPTIDVDPSRLRDLRIQVWHAYSDPAEDIFIGQLARFNTTNEWGIIADPAPQGDYPSLFEAVNSALESGTPPDLVIALPEQALTWESGGAVVDLSAYIDDPVWGLKDGEVEDFYPSIWAQDEVDGKHIGAPAQRSARFLFYNRSWGRALGYDQPPVTADEFQQQACAANASFRRNADPADDGYGGWVVDGDWATAYSWLLAFGGGVTGDRGYDFASDANISALEFLKRLFDRSCAFFSTELTPYETFARRSALFVTADLSEASLMAETMSRLNNPDEWSLIPFPGTESSLVVTYGPSYVLLASTPEKGLAAWLFARWLLSPEYEARWVETTGTLPLRGSTLDLLGGYGSAHPQWAAAVDTLLQAAIVPQLASWRTVRYALGDSLNYIFRIGIPVSQIPSILQELDATAKDLDQK